MHRLIEEGDAHAVVNETRGAIGSCHREQMKDPTSPPAPHVTPVPAPPPAPLFAEPYVAVIFTSVRAAGDGPDDNPGHDNPGHDNPGHDNPGHADAEGYAAMAGRMDSLAREQPGYLGIESARGADGLGITVSYWATEADAVAWKQVTEHLGAQRLGRERWYQHYVTRIAVVSRSYAWQRESR